MNRYFFVLAWMMLSGLIMTGCVRSQGDYDQAVRERDELKKALQETKNENRVLNEAITAAYQERDRLLAKIGELDEEFRTLSEPPASEEAKAAEQESAARAERTPPPAPPETPPTAETEPAERKPAETKPEPDIPGILYYYANPNDTLQDVARRTGVPIGTLKALNDLPDGTALSKGQRLRLR